MLEHVITIYNIYVRLKVWMSVESFTYIIFLEPMVSICVWFILMGARKEIFYTNVFMVCILSFAFGASSQI